MSDFGNYIAGEWVKSGDAGPNVNPSNIADVIGHYAKADKHQAEAAIAAAGQAAPGWARTTPQQRVLTGTLRTLPGIVQASGVHAPTLIIIGEVVRLRERLKWFESAA